MRQIYKVHGITCSQCKKKIEQTLLAYEGIETVNVSMRKKELEVIYNHKILKERTIKHSLKSLGYELIDKDDVDNNRGLLYIILALAGFWALNSLLPDLSMLLTQGNSLSLMVLFIIGITTSFHCISMCGGIALSQVVGEGDGAKRNVLYNSGRIISYTMLGGVAGAFGSGITLDNTFFTAVPLFLGLVMILMGLNNVGFLRLFEWKALQKFNLHLARFKNKLGTDQGPFALGLINGFMPCGPLQLMQIYALSTGSFIDGALAMLAFSLGTLPLMLGMGVFIQKLSIKAREMVFQAGGILIILLGVGMIKNSLSTLGIDMTLGGQNGASFLNRQNTNYAAATLENDYQLVEFDATASSYKDIVVQKGIPVKMVVNVPSGQLSSCNYALTLPQYDTAVVLKEGSNLIEFTPTEEGEFTYSCWMGMIRHTITVVDGDIDTYTPPQQSSEPNTFNPFNLGAGASCH